MGLIKILRQISLEGNVIKNFQKLCPDEEKGCSVRDLYKVCYDRININRVTPP